MPKETIYGDGLPYGTPEDPGPGRSVAELTWNREAGHVQLVTKCIDASTGDDYHEPLKAIPVPADGTPAELEMAEHLPDFRNGFYVTLNRDGINRLIRNLRRARDQAFGRDE